MMPGKYYKVKRIADNTMSVKLVCMGIIPGKVISLIRRAPFGGAFYISCDDKRLGIAASELQRIELEEVTVEQKAAI